MTVGSDDRAPRARAEPLPVWRLLDLGTAEPERAQAFAEAVAPSVGSGAVPNTLILVRPSAPYISLGFHQSFAEELEPTFLHAHPIPVIRRVEGGGTTYLDTDQLFYQLIYREEGGGPGGGADLARYLAAPARAARALGVEAALRPPSDLVVGERKISGNAGGDWEGAHLVVGGYLGRSDTTLMAELLRLPSPALRPLLRREVDRWITSLERETGTFPDWNVLSAALVDAFRSEGLFDARPGVPTEEEERRFREETVPRHRDPAWREIPPIPPPPGAPLRRLRVAGPHGLLVFGDEERGALAVAAVDGVEVREGYLLRRDAGEPPHRLPNDAPALAELRRSVSRAGGID